MFIFHRSHLSSAAVGISSLRMQVISTFSTLYLVSFHFVYRGGMARDLFLKIKPSFLLSVSGSPPTLWSDLAKRREVTIVFGRIHRLPPRH